MNQQEIDIAIARRDEVVKILENEYSVQTVKPDLIDHAQSVKTP